MLYKLAKRDKITIFNPAPAEKFDDIIYEYVDYLILNETEMLKIFDIDAKMRKGI